MLFLGVMSTVAVGLISACFHALVRLSSVEWRGFLWILVVVGPLMFVGTSLLNRPLVRPVQRHLDAEVAGEATPDGLREAFRALSDLPFQFFRSGLFWWTAAGFFTAGVMAWRFEAFGAFRFASMSLAATGGGFVCSVFVFFGLKRINARLLRELGRRIPDPGERQALVRRIDVGRKLRWSVTGVTFVTVAFALFVSLIHGSQPLEENAVRIQAAWLDHRAAALEADPAALAGLHEEAAALGIAAQLLIVDPESGRVVDGEAAALLDSELAEVRGAAGNSLTFDSPHAFAWRSLGEGRPVVVAVQPWEAISPSPLAGWLRFGLTLGLSAAIALALAQELSRDLGAGTQELGASAERVAAGDLRFREVFESEDELGVLARSFERMSAALRATVGRVSEAADRVEATATEAATVSESVAAAAESQGRGVVESARAIQGLSEQGRDIATSAQELNLLVEDASSSILELGTSGEQLAETANVLFGKVDEVSSAIQQGVQSMREVSRNTGSLAEAAENTSSSMSRMAGAMREVDAAAADSAERSRRVVETAERGRETVRQTVESMESIRSATDSAESVIRGLGARAQEIGTIVDVIGDVADETNLLALNAAIIAAQAGEDGRAFSVVAEEIKGLADRVLSSTKEIGDLIRAVQQESANAALAISAGSTNVAEGVRLSAEAGASLEEITRVSRESGERIDHILSAVQEQTRASSYVVEQMESVKRGVDAIQRATAEQDRGNEVVVRSTEAMRDIAQQLQATTVEQARGTLRIRESVEGVRRAAETIHGALQSQTRSSGQVGGFLDELSTRGEGNQESARRVREVARQLLEQANALREDVERFRL